MDVNLGLLFLKDLYRKIENNAIIELTGVDDKNLENKINRILEARVFTNDDPERRVCDPCIYPEQDTSGMTALSISERLKRLDMPQNVDELMQKLMNIGKVRTQNSRRRDQPVHTNAAAADQPPNDSEIWNKRGLSSLTMQVAYPGLYCGIGINHGVGDRTSGDSGNQTDFSLGFSFDYLSGLPYIPGSGVKGALRVCFIDYADDILDYLTSESNDMLDEDKLVVLEKKLFGNRTAEMGAEDVKGEMGEAVFFDAFPVFDSKYSGSLLAVDYITPHPDKLKDPGPIIKTIKIAPGNRIRFFFKIPDEIKLSDDVSINKEIVLKLFRYLLQNWGIGAKKNSGYGRFR